MIEIKYKAILEFPSLGKVKEKFDIDSPKEKLYFPFVARYISPVAANSPLEDMPNMKKLEFVYERMHPIEFERDGSRWEPVVFECLYSFNGLVGEQP